MRETTFEPFVVPGATVDFLVDQVPSTSRPGVVEFERPLRTVRPGFDAGGRAGVPDVLVAAARARAREEGYAAGLAEGRAAAAAAVQADLDTAARAREAAVEAATAEVAAAVDAVRDAAKHLEERRDATAAELVDAVVEGIGALVGAVLGHALTDGEDTALDAVRRALQPLPGNGPVLVALAPDDARLLHGAAHLLEATSTVDGREVTIVADTSLQRGDAVATSGAARVEVRLAEALARAVAALSS